MLITKISNECGGLLPQCFDLSCYPSKQCVGMHVSSYVLCKQLNCLGNNYNIHPVINFDLPTH